MSRTFNKLNSTKTDIKAGVSRLPRVLHIKVDFHRNFHNKSDDILYKESILYIINSYFIHSVQTNGYNSCFLVKYLCYDYRNEKTSPHKIGTHIYGKSYTSVLLVRRFLLCFCERLTN